MRPFYLYALALLNLGAACLSATAEPGGDEFDLARSKGTYETRLAAIAEEAAKEYAESMAPYEQALATLAARYKKAGNLDAVLAVNAEIERYARARTLGKDDIVAKPTSLAGLQENYARLPARIETMKAKRVRDLASKYTTYLEQAMKELTRADEVDRAVRFREEIARVMASDAVKAAEAMLRDATERTAHPAKEVDETDFRFVAPKTRTSTGSPSLTWHQHPGNGHWYAVLPPLRYDAARQFAKQVRGNLAVIRDRDENQWIVDTFAGHRHKLFFIGLERKRSGDMEWATSQGSQFYSWMPNEPNNHRGNETVTVMNALSGKWNDVPRVWRAASLVELAHEPPAKLTARQEKLFTAQAPRRR